MLTRSAVGNGAVQVSTIVAVYNGAATLARALDSVLSQQFAGNHEIIVVDDGSTDRSAEIVRLYEGRIKLIGQRNRGLAAARNRGVEASGGEYLAFLDADDVWYPKRLAKTVAPLMTDADKVLAYSDLIPTDEREVELAATYIRSGLAHAPSMDEMLHQWWPILPSTVIMRRTVFERCGGCCERFRGPGGFDDVYLWMLAREHGHFHYSNEPLVRYRLTPFAERMRKYAAGFRIFARNVRAHWGAAGDALIRRSAKNYAWLLTMRATRYLADGDRRAARRTMLCAFRYRPRFDAALRVLITIMPQSNTQKMIKTFLSHPRTPLDYDILCRAIPIDLR